MASWEVPESLRNLHRQGGSGMQDAFFGRCETIENRRSAGSGPPSGEKVRKKRGPQGEKLDKGSFCPEEVAKTP